MNIEKKRRSLRKSIKRYSSLSLKAGMTVEASLVLPLFIFFMANVLYIFDMIRLQSNLFAALQQTGYQVSQYAYYYRYGVSDARQTFPGKAQEEGSAAGSTEAGGEAVQETETGDAGESGDTGLSRGALSMIFSQTYVRKSVENYLGTEYLRHSCLEGGEGSISYLRSSVLADDKDIVDITADYRIRPFIPILAPDSFSMQSRFYGHAWTGYARREDDAETTADENEEIVYVTPSGSVYHRSRDCTYLKPRVRPVPASQISSERSGDGSKYYACEECRPARTGILYITPEGNRYHSSTACSSLSREIREVPISAVRDHMRACSKCGG